MRVMAYGGALIFLISLIGGYLLWRGRLGEKRWFLHLAVWVAPLPFIMNIAGWLLTENGRQPWIVQGLQLTKDGVSSSVGTATIVTSIIIFFVLYGVLAIVDTILMTHYARKQLAPESETPEEPAEDLEFISY
jgi:cytochrome d ubiquinol oxidase subunit I